MEEKNKFGEPGLDMQSWMDPRAIWWNGGPSAVVCCPHPSVQVPVSSHPSASCSPTFMGIQINALGASPWSSLLAMTEGLKDTHSSSPSPLGRVNLMYLLCCLPGSPTPTGLNPSCTQVAFCLVVNPWLLCHFLTSPAGAFWETLPN